ncbi:hypothetical protein [Oleidesulfovibrio sp.]|uniref:hypothetical protein n=1 Tax=Oleidesulfovibrio sp. TaxID=2909707 RepID=UPI003A8C57E0
MAEKTVECTVVVLAVPHLHPSSGTGVLSLPAVKYFNPGLSAAASTGAELFTPEDLPLQGAAAKGCLHELAVMAQNFGSSRDLVMFALNSDQSEGGRDRNHNELADLTAFIQAEGGAFEAAESAVPVKKDLRIEAQKTLLLAYSLEESVNELDSLQARYEKTLASMSDVLGVEADDDLKDLPGLVDMPAELRGSGADMMQLSWRVILDNMGVFLRSGTILVTEDTSMSETLAELPEAAPLNAEKAAALCPAWDETALAGKGELMTVQAPLWRILGNNAPAAGREWHQYEFTVVFSAAGSAAKL